MTGVIGCLLGGGASGCVGATGVSARLGIVKLPLDTLNILEDAFAVTLVVPLVPAVVLGRFVSTLKFVLLRPKLGCF